MYQLIDVATRLVSGLAAFAALATSVIQWRRERAARRDSIKPASDPDNPSADDDAPA